MGRGPGAAQQYLLDILDHTPAAVLTDLVPFWPSWRETWESWRGSWAYARPYRLNDREAAAQHVADNIAVPELRLLDKKDRSQYESLRRAAHALGERGDLDLWRAATSRPHEQTPQIRWFLVISRIDDDPTSINHIQYRPFYWFQPVWYESQYYEQGLYELDVATNEVRYIG